MSDYWKRSLSQITTVNPATGEEISKFNPMDKDQVFQLVGKAKRVKKT
jgi:acyl-CoA reductase-like NAD-dependent aldehyde dehydrogenase